MLATQAARLLASPAGATAAITCTCRYIASAPTTASSAIAGVFPEFTAATPAAMRREVLLFLRWVFDEGGGVKEIFTAPVSFVNATLAPLYGLPARRSQRRSRRWT